MKTRTLLPISVAIGIVLISILSLPMVNAQSPVYVQSAFGTGTGAGGGVSISFGSNVHSGNLLIVSYAAELGMTTCPTPTDTFSTTFTLVKCFTNMGGNTAVTGLFAAISANTGADGITVSTTNPNLIAMQIIEVSGASVADVLFPSSNGGVCTSATSCTLSVSSFTQGPITFGTAVTGGNNGGSWTIPSGYTNQGCTTTSGIFGCGIIDKTGANNGLSGTLQMTYSWTGSTTTDWVIGGGYIQGSTTISTTITQTIVGWVFPNFINGTNNFSAILGLVVLLMPLFLFEIFMATLRKSLTNIPMMLLALTFGSFFAVMLNFLPLFTVVLFIALDAFYFWKGR